MNFNEHSLSIASAFNKASSTYEDNSFAQQKIGNRLIQLIHMYFPEAQSIIDLGCGNGLITKELASDMHYTQFNAIDIAEKSILLASHCLSNFNIKLEKMDFNQISCINTFDLAFSNMALHWSLDFRKTLSIIYQSLCDNGVLAFTIPLDGTFSELPNQSKNKFHTLNTIKTLLNHCGFHILYQTVESIKMNYISGIEALRSIKLSGANSLFKKTHHYLSREEIKKIASLTYEIGYFIARKNTHGN